MNIRNKLKNHPIIRNFVFLVSGTVIAQIILIGFQLVLRRLYSPEEFGAFAVYMSIVGILSTISSLRYDQTIILPKDDSDGFHLLALSVSLAFVMSLLFGATFILVHNPIVDLFFYSPHL